MKTEQPTLEQIRLKIRELRAEASRLFQAGEIEQASKLFEHAVRLEDLVSHLLREEELKAKRGYTG